MINAVMVPSRRVRGFWWSDIVPPLSIAITGRGGNWVTKPGRHIEISKFQEESVQANGNTLAEATSPIPSFLGVPAIVILSFVEGFAFIAEILLNRTASPCRLKSLHDGFRKLLGRRDGTHVDNEVVDLAISVEVHLIDRLNLLALDLSLKAKKIPIVPSLSR